MNCFGRRVIIILTITLAICGCKKDSVSNPEPKVPEISWQRLTAANAFWIVYSIAINSKGYIFAGGDLGIGRSADNGSSWQVLNTGFINNFVYSIIITSSGTLFAGTPGGLYGSTDDGATWSEHPFFFNHVILSFVINANGDIFAGTPEGVYRSTDQGLNWILTANGLPSTFPSAKSLAIHPNSHIFATISNGGVYRSTNNAASWSLSGLGSIVLNVVGISPSGYIFAGAGIIYRSTDDGASWTEPSSTAETNISIQSLSVNSSGHSFTGTFANGVHRSTDNGSTWTQVNMGLTNLKVFSLAVDSRGYLLAGTGGNGVFRTTGTTNLGN